MDSISKGAITKADVEVTGLPKTDMMATKLEQEEFQLDKLKIEYDMQAATEYFQKVKSRESRQYFKRLEKVNKRCNKVEQAIVEFLDPQSVAGRVWLCSAREQKTVWQQLETWSTEIRNKEGLQSTDAISVIVMNNWAAPSVISSDHQKLQAAITGAVCNRGSHCAGLTVQPVWSYAKGQVVDTGAKLLKLIENNNVMLDGNFSIIFEKRSDEREDRTLNYPGRLCLGAKTNRADNVWMT